MNALARLATAALLFVTACAVPPEEPEDATESDLVRTAQTAVKEQVGGTCWIYTTTGWVESLVKHSYGYEAHYSEAYLVYWDWFEKIMAGDLDPNEVSGIDEGGTWGRGVELIRRYGLMKDVDLFPGLGPDEIETKIRVARLFMKIQLAKKGALATAASRKDPRVVRDSLNWAFDFVHNDVAAHLDRVFGAGAVSMRLDVAYKQAHLPKSMPMWRAQDIEVKVIDPSTKEEIDSHLDMAIGTAPTSSDPDTRVGPYAWSKHVFPQGAQAQRLFFRRMQLTLADGVAVPISWLVPSDAMSDRLVGPGQPGRYGGHATLVSDYEAYDVPGYGTLYAGGSSPADAQDAALADSAKIRFVRVKNSWGGGTGIVPTWWWPPAGYNDLFTSYLTTPVTACDGADAAHLVNCKSRLPLKSMVLPAGH